jgi:PAS domain S-box-containing protein/putative nucleotidyltransferase with HDIG domain
MLHDEIIGIIAISSSTLTEYFVPSVKSLATHVSTSLDIADRYAKQKELQDSLKETHQLDTAIFSSVQAGIILCDDKLNYKMWNPFMERISGMPASEVIGKNALDLFPHIRQQGLDRLLQRALNGETVFSQDTRYFVEKTGKSGWLTCSYTPHMNTKGEIVGVIVLVTEITDRKRMEERLQLTQFSLDSSLTGIYWINEEGDFVYVNDAACRQLGYSEKELLTMNVADLDPLYPRETRKKQWKKIKREKILVFESLQRSKDGSVHPIEVTSNYLKFNDSEYEFAFVIDITERKNAQEKLHRSEERYRRIAERSFDTIFLISIDGTIEYTSPSVSEIIGYTPDEIAGQSFMKFVPETDMVSINETFHRVLRGQDIREMYIHVRKKDGSIVLLEFNATPIFENGTIVGIQGNARDITERFSLQQEHEEHLQKTLNVMKSVIDTLALTVEKRDPYTAGHQRRVTQLAVAIATEMGLPESSIEALSMAGIIHDIGKIYIPSEILAKPGKLSNAEYSMVKVHSQAGYELLKNIDFPWPIADIVYQHHERLNGSGYPQGLRDENMLIESKILAVADVVEAMASHRPYRPSQGIDHALTEISEKKGILYDPEVVDTCCKLFNSKGFEFEKTGGESFFIGTDSVHDLIPDER